MNWVDFLIIVALAFAFLDGVRGSLRRSLAKFGATVAAIPTAGAIYELPSWALSFLPGSDWEHFLGFGIAFVVPMVALTLVLRLALHDRSKGYFGGCLDRPLGGGVNALATTIGMFIMSLVIVAYPIIGLRPHLLHSQILSALAHSLTFVHGMLPEVLRQAASALSAGL